ncbi:MAG: hypothetical protein LLG00_01445 [Planctomycetaceae bacterium]|nr:hypothetical protein [Planctomycetaceae bacterium]
MPQGALLRLHLPAEVLCSGLPAVCPEGVRSSRVCPEGVRSGELCSEGVRSGDLLAEDLLPQEEALPPRPDLPSAFVLPCFDVQAEDVLPEALRSGDLRSEGVRPGRLCPEGVRSGELRSEGLCSGDLLAEDLLPQEEALPSRPDLPSAFVLPCFDL